MVGTDVRASAFAKATADIVNLTRPPKLKA
jgi:hypothetical protein